MHLCEVGSGCRTSLRWCRTRACSGKGSAEHIGMTQGRCPISGTLARAGISQRRRCPADCLRSHLSPAPTQRMPNERRKGTTRVKSSLWVLPSVSEASDAAHANASNQIEYGSERRSHDPAAETMPLSSIRCIRFREEEEGQTPADCTSGAILWR